ncbi:hypothetical protein ACJ73_06930 [Blastomyces percursus]|uniref:Protein kinase domain-containing protein n=1 Tax=Blastomyces percursus TaxID=1658174 RepID=A0A1J9PZI6_9EURO|nr:hypothetical protein ACJ73_06930 [Blastomyces percursus]
MGIVLSNEAFKDIDGKFQFIYRQIIVRQDNVLYSAKWTDRSNEPHDLSQLLDIQPVETQIGSCEILRKHPHPNIAFYYGCQVIHGRDSGLWFKRYSSTLLEKVNPKNLNKFAFLSSGRPLVDDFVKASLLGILQGIQDLHLLGLVHNDIAPAKIMFTEDGTPVLIDFDSCRQVRELLRDTETERTHEWHNPDVKIALKNDLDAFTELKTRLIGSVADEFLFK